MSRDSGLVTSRGGEGASYKDGQSSSSTKPRDSGNGVRPKDSESRPRSKDTGSGSNYPIAASDLKFKK